MRLDLEKEMQFRYIDEDYVDVDVFIPDPDNEGGEWDFMVSKIRKTGEFDISAVTYAENKDAAFEDRDEPPPYLVMKKLAVAMPQIMAYINECELGELK